MGIFSLSLQRYDKQWYLHNLYVDLCLILIGSFGSKILNMILKKDCIQLKWNKISKTNKRKGGSKWYKNVFSSLINSLIAMQWVMAIFPRIDSEYVGKNSSSCIIFQWFSKKQKKTIKRKHWSNHVRPKKETVKQTLFSFSFFILVIIWM